MKCLVATSVYGLDLSAEIHMYTDASARGAGMCVTQFWTPEQAYTSAPGKEKLVKVPIIYDSFTFNPTQRLYPTYKKELCALVKCCEKYNYLFKHSYLTAIVHTDHRPLIHFLKSDTHKGIYGHWADKLRRLNLTIRYIPGPRNKVANRVSRTLFEEDKKIREVPKKMRNPPWI